MRPKERGGRKERGQRGEMREEGEEKRRGERERLTCQQKIPTLVQRSRHILMIMHVPWIRFQALKTKGDNKTG